MNKQRAYIEGFVKRANEYGYSEAEAVVLLKVAASWREAGSSVRQKLYKKLSPTEAKRLISNYTHPHGIDAGRIATVAKNLRSPDMSQQARIRDVIAQKLKDHASGVETEHLRSYMNDAVTSPGVVDRLLGASRKVFSPKDIKQKINEVGSLYSRPSLP